MRSQEVPVIAIPPSLALLLSKKHGNVMITPFQQKVFAATCLVPAGKVTTYQQIARRIDCKSAQAVGQALKRNPYAPTVPCHRVVATNTKTIGGFSGQRQGEHITRKKNLLLDEGVEFDSEGRVVSSCFHVF
jgi:methylated-DNA-[protein]-cysteine S-methyltransferase